MYSTENSGGPTGSGEHATRVLACGPSQPPVASRLTAGAMRADQADDDAVGGDAFRQWTVVAVVVNADRVGLLPIGMVMAADLELAADQVCHRLPAPDGSGARYLVASPCTLEVDLRMGRVITVPQLTWVNRMQWRDDAWSLNEWVPAEGGLRMLDPQRWRAPQRRSAES
ncbi:hypothetical protein [Nocardia sp. NBC_01327]|uniref:hypothetical protein n=1 Tax=Nocardia sp. NBC_01327 TaxID=2903593 RepID=UPI002E143E74|nr:hypothetical protein OG326_10035 [Nocardia sp. NBC_01327]